MRHLALLVLASLPLACVIDDPSSDDEAEADETDETDETDASETGEPEPATLSTCGSGGATGQWTRYEVELSWYEVLAPPPGDQPLALVIALHGDEGNPSAVQYEWTPSFMTHGDFIVATPQLHTQADGPTTDNGWDDNPDAGMQLIEQVLADLGERYDIDINRTYLTSVSAGSWWMGQRGYSMQEYFAAAQISCGASPIMWGLYDLPSEDCRMPTRFEIAADDFLYSYAETMRDELIALGHEVEFSVSECSGHCCGGPELYGEKAWEFFRTRVRCGGVIEGEPGGSCGSFGQL